MVWVYILTGSRLRCPCGARTPSTHVVRCSKYAHARSAGCAKVCDKPYAGRNRKFLEAYLHSGNVLFYAHVVVECSVVDGLEYRAYKQKRRTVGCFPSVLVRVVPLMRDGGRDCGEDRAGE